MSARGDAGEARERAAGILDPLARWSARHVETLGAELKRLRVARDGASAEELPRIQAELTQTNAEYDRLLLVWVRQCEARQELGSDTRFTKRAGTAVVTCTPRSGYPSVSVSVPWT